MLKLYIAATPQKVGARYFEVEEEGGRRGEKKSGGMRNTGGSRVMPSHSTIPEQI